MNKIPVTQIDEAQIEEIRSYYPPEDKFYVRLIEGRFQNLRRLVSWPLLAMFFSLVWIQVDGQPLLFFSFAERTIYLFGLTLSWHDLPIMAGLMIAGACLLFFMAVGWGRVWCGFACPQSIWTWLFIRIEDWAEGKASQRAKNDKLPLTGVRLARRVLKHVLWIATALYTTLTFSGYFVPIQQLIVDLATWEAPLYTVGWVICMAALTYLNAGLVREKICLHACPYSRFQSVMFDKNTQTVTYDVARGEPRRMSRKQRAAMADRTDSVAGADNLAMAAVAHTVHDVQTREAAKSRGDCVDCGICVQVCPVGIDIRDGLQAECIDCGACIDACDGVMEKIGLSKGLIRFASEAELAGNSDGRNGWRAVFRPKLAGYATVMSCAVVAVMLGFMNTIDLLVEVRRDRLELFTRIDDQTVCNNYHLKVESFNQGIDAVTVSVDGLSGVKLHGQKEIDIKENNAAWRSYRVCTSQASVPRTEIQFVFSTPDAEVRKKTTFLTSSI
ncbi:4Fe-4S dicluster domain-containing protein [Oceanospirillum sediminis]|uniref:4Fe-4S binding protein n=1 Tax=Oceanospirillum sediminis TaxID=2760088 RepID=A0A839IKS9_9GAMM|nr:4Fe-4S dicluster domain-containing protein [Oceanospirillum sediminis]MBB1485548.1 4Fe-4S binding protein [Oceanospirillum sediminis]